MSDQHGGGSLPNETRLNTAGVAMWVVGLALTLPLLLAGVDAYFNKVVSEQLVAKIGHTPNTELNDSRAKWDSERTSYGVVDAETGRYRVPLDEAKTLYLAKVKAAQEAAAAQVPVEPAIEGAPAVEGGAGEVPAPE